MIDSKVSGGIGGAAQGASAGAAFGPWGAVIGGVAGGIAGILGGGGEDEAQELAEAQAKMITDTRAENKLREQWQLSQDLGMIRATQGASNIQFSGSSENYKNVYESRFRHQMAWDDNKAKMDARMALKGGDMAASSIQSAGVSSMIGGLGSAAGTFGGGFDFGSKPKSTMGMTNTDTSTWGIGL
jgi:hypothetical protein